MDGDSSQLARVQEDDSSLDNPDTAMDVDQSDRDAAEVTDALNTESPASEPIPHSPPVLVPSRPSLLREIIQIVNSEINLDLASNEELLFIHKHMHDFS